MTRPAISVLLPTRGRPGPCRRSVLALRHLASRPQDIELLIRHDEDDPPPPFSHEADEAGAFAAFRILSGPRHGYAGMHRYYNELAAEARGDWLLIWNDDTDMLTPGWDLMLREAPPFCVQFPRRDITATTDFTFPVLGRPVYETLGHVATNGYCDAWLSDVTCYAGVAVLRDDIVFHHHRLDDETMRGQHRDGPPEWARFGSIEEGVSRRSAMEAIRGAPAWPDRFCGWAVEEVRCGEGTVGLSTGPARASCFILRGRP